MVERIVEFKTVLQVDPLGDLEGLEEAEVDDLNPIALQDVAGDVSKRVVEASGRAGSVEDEPDIVWVDRREGSLVQIRHQEEPGRAGPEVRDSGGRTAAGIEDAGIDIGDCDRVWRGIRVADKRTQLRDPEEGVHIGHIFVGITGCGRMGRGVANAILDPGRHVKLPAANDTTEDSTLTTHKWQFVDDIGGERMRNVKTREALLTAGQIEWVLGDGHRVSTREVEDLARVVERLAPSVSEPVDDVPAQPPVEAGLESVVGRLGAIDSLTGDAEREEPSVAGSLVVEGCRIIDAGYSAGSSWQPVGKTGEGQRLIGIGRQIEGLTRKSVDQWVDKWIGIDRLEEPNRVVANVADFKDIASDLTLNPKRPLLRVG